MNIIVYSKPACPACEQAKSLLKSKGINYEELILDVGQPKLDGKTYVSREDVMARLPNAKTMPQILNGETVIGGIVELRQYLSSSAS